jgi:isopentenyl diphosphate isomerase/L-lactate dehydrogenase-like FMN-dependent dehydrogenase
LLLLVIPLVVVDGGRMGHDDVVGCDIGFPVGVAAIAGPKRRGAVVGRVLAQQVGELGEQVGLVERRPELDPVTERLEAHVRVVVELLPANTSFLDQGK